MSKIFKLLFSRLVIVGIMILIQALFWIAIAFGLSEYFIYIHIFFLIISIGIIIYMINKNSEPSFKLPWVILLLITPIVGSSVYLMFGDNKMSKKFQRRVKDISQNIMEEFNSEFKQNEAVKKELYSLDKTLYNQSQYISNVTAMPIYQNTTTQYLPIGELFYERLLEELKQAKHFIFMEFFILQEGVMLNTILDILAQKVKEGLEVRMMYDDLGCIYTLPNKYYKKLETLGIKCVVFNPFIPVLSIGHNNRDHRKIVVIDGYIGFTGGINLADEYINAIVKHGHWKDSGIMLKGDAVKNLTLMFLESWNFYQREDKNLKDFMPHVYHPESFDCDGFVQPFGDTPLDQENVAETVYMNIINNATDYLYINTPYLIIDYNLLYALEMAAKRGVDVRITTPHIEDKWFVHIVTQSYYLTLIKSGVKIYEYTPGFIHAKTFVSDDKISIVGTINLDYRSLCHHFECGVWMYGSQAVMDVKKDYLETLKICMPVTEEFCNNIPWIKKATRELLKVCAPLM